MTTQTPLHPQRHPTGLAAVRWAAGLALAGLSLVVSAQSFPTKPVTIVVPYPAGGTTDVLARVIAEPMQKILGQQVVVDNKPGASALLGTRLVARAPADGYTLVMPNNGLVISPHVVKDVGFAPLKDFAPVSMLSLQPMVMVINPAVPAQTVPQFIAWAKANPGKVDYATAGPASFGHLATELFAKRAGLQMNHIPYKGQAPTAQAVLTGEVKLLISTTSSQMNGFIKEGKMRLLGVASPQPSPLAPGATPISQSVAGFNAEVWFGLLAPAGTPKEVIVKLNDAVNKVLSMPEVQAKFEAAGAAATPSTPEQFAARLAEEYASWGTIVKEANIKGD